MGLTEQELKQAQNFINDNKIENDYFYYHYMSKTFTLNFKKVIGKKFFTLKAYQSILEGYGVPSSAYYPIINMLKYTKVN